jgi:ATP-binding cassette, subfamily B, bacterial
VTRDLHLYRRMLREARPFRGRIVSLVALSLLATPLALLLPLPLKIAVDSIVGDHPLPGFLAAVLPASVEHSKTGALVSVVCLLVAIAMAQQLLRLAASYLQASTGERLVLDFRTKLFAHVQRLSFGYHDSRGSSDAIYRIQYDAMAIQKIAVDAVMPLVTALFTIVGMFAVTASIDWRLALIAVALSPLLVLGSWHYRSRVRPKWREAKKLETSALGVVQEVLTGLRVVRAFGQETREHERFIARSAEGVRTRLRLTLMQGAFALGVGLVTAVSSALVLYVGISEVRGGAMTLGELLLVMTYLTQLYEPLETASAKTASLQGALVNAERAFDLLDESADVPERASARALAKPARGEVAFHDVAFEYEEDRPVLDGVSFEVPPGTHVAIAGPTGAGKTTLVSLLMRFYDPTRGEVVLDGVDVRDIRLADLRRQFAIVLQEPVLFSTSIAENIAYARPDASFEEIEAAARAAHAHDFIAALPEGFSTSVGERGVRLSGGERQRISLARAFLKDAPVLILDEATSSIDVRTEALIMEAMDRLMEGRTTFMIAHRLSTLRDCDIQLQLDDGRIADIALPAAIRWGRRVSDQVHGIQPPLPNEPSILG